MFYGDILRLLNYIKINANLTKTEVIDRFENNKILVNNHICSLSYIIKDNDIITLDGHIIEKISFKYYLYNKPRGIISDISNKPSSYINHINVQIKLMPVGRLDKESRGLMILTNDGNYINSLLNPNNHVEKEYLVYVKNIITDDFLKRLNSIKKIDNHILKPFTIKRNDNISFYITLNEGRYHQIRKMVKLALNEVIDLIRIRIDKYSIDEVLEGEIKEIKN